MWPQAADEMLNSDNFVWNIPCEPLSGQTVLSRKEVTGSFRKCSSDFCLICYYNVIIIIIILTVME